jgi:hypothetical protein
LIEVYVNRLRKKIDPPGSEPLLHTRRGAGYFIGRADGSQPPAKESEPAGKHGAKAAVMGTRKGHV